MLSNKVGSRVPGCVHLVKDVAQSVAGNNKTLPTTLPYIPYTYTLNASSATFLLGYVQ